MHGRNGWGLLIIRFPAEAVGEGVVSHPVLLVHMLDPASFTLLFKDLFKCL